MPAQRAATMPICVANPCNLGQKMSPVPVVALFRNSASIGTTLPLQAYLGRTPPRPSEIVGLRPP